MPTYCLHGFLGKGKDWNFVNSSIYTPDLWENGHLSLDDWATEFNKTVDPEEDNILVGYSLGGRLALHALTHSPFLWKKAVLISTHPGLEEGREKRLFHDVKWAERFRSEPWNSVVTDWNSQGVLSSIYHPPREESDFDKEKLAEGMINWSLGRQRNLRAQIRDLSFPMLWIVGERDSKFCRLAESVSLNERSCHLQVSDAGHRILVDQPQKIAALIHEFERF